MLRRPSLRVAVLATAVAAMPTLVRAQSPVPAPAPAAAPANAATRVIEGRVVDLRGDGVPAAQVFARTWNDPTPLARTVADGDGFFRLAKVPAASAQVCASVDGHCLGVALASATTATVEVEVHHAATLRGTLRNAAGRPAGGVTVRADPTGRSLTYVQAEAVTGADGAFELRAVPLAPVLVSAWIDGEGLHEVRTRVTGDADVVLMPPASPTTRIDVTVVGLPDGCEPPSLSLLPYRNGSLKQFPPPYTRPRLAAGATWSLSQAPDCDYTLSPGLAGFAFAPREIRLQRGKGPHAVRFTATAVGSQSLECRVVVRGPDGAPVAGLPLVMRTIGGAGQTSADTDGEGRATFASVLAAGTDVVVYTTDDRWVVDQPKAGMPWESDRRFLSWFETKFDPAATLELRVVAASSVEGRLLLPDGRPAPFVRLELQSSRANVSPSWGAMAFATSRRDGTFRFPRLHHLADDVRILVNAKAGAATSGPLQLPEAATRLAVGDLRLAEPAIVEGVVRDARQRPAPGVPVWLRDWDFARNGQGSGSVVEVTTDRDGRYRFRGVPPGGAWLQLVTDVNDDSPDGRAVEPFEVEPGRTYVHDLQLPQ